VLALAVGLLLPLGTPATASAAACSNPQFVTSDENGMWSDGDYIVHNNMWNVSGYDVTETLAACSHRNWKVTATADNARGDGAVKTYPNVHRDFHDWSTGQEPRLSSFSRIRSTWAARTPHVGIYDAAYDIWLNGVPGEHEVMIWTDNFHQVPAGSVVERGLTFAHRTWKLFATGDHGYLAFVPDKPLPSGSIALKKRLTYLIRSGYMPHGSRVGQICFGYEVVSTGGTLHRFKIDRFSIASPRK
jgi:hypothetical protein